MFQSQKMLKNHKLFHVPCSIINPSNKSIRFNDSYFKGFGPIKVLCEKS